MEKRTEVITIRITAETKRRLTAIAEKREWSIAQTANKILTEYLDRQEDSSAAGQTDL